MKDDSISDWIKTAVVLAIFIVIIYKWYHLKAKTRRWITLAFMLYLSIGVIVSGIAEEKIAAIILGTLFLSSLIPIFKMWNIEDINDKKLKNLKFSYFGAFTALAMILSISLASIIGTIALIIEGESSSWIVMPVVTIISSLFIPKYYKEHNKKIEDINTYMSKPEELSPREAIAMMEMKS